MCEMKDDVIHSENQKTPSLVTCQAEGCVNGLIDGESCETCWGTSLVSDGEPGSESYQEMEKTEAEIQRLRASSGYGPELTLAGLKVLKVSDEIPYVGYLQVHPITETLSQAHEWLGDHLGSLQRPFQGTYRVAGTNRIFFINWDQIEVHAEEGDTHPLMIVLERDYPAPANHNDMNEQERVVLVRFSA